jgi:hypothetical protein
MSSVTAEQRAGRAAGDQQVGAAIAPGQDVAAVADQNVVAAGAPPEVPVTFWMLLILLAGASRSSRASILPIP